MKLTTTVLAAVATSFALITATANADLLDLGEPCYDNEECESHSCFTGMMMIDSEGEDMDVGDMPPGQCVCNTVSNFPCDNDFSVCSESDIIADGPPYCFIPINGPCEYNEECKSGFCDPDSNACKCNQYMGKVECDDEDSFFEGDEIPLPPPEEMYAQQEEIPLPPPEEELYAQQEEGELPEIYYDEPEDINVVEEAGWEEGEEEENWDVEEEENWGGDEVEEEEEEYWVDEEGEGEEGEEEYWVDEEVEEYEDEEFAEEEDEEGA